MSQVDIAAVHDKSLMCDGLRLIGGNTNITLS